MSDWPPKPNNEVPSSDSRSGKEWQILEKAVLASVEEQRRSRRWGIFFKCLTFAYILLLLLMMGRGCTTATTSGAGSSSNAHLAVIDIIGTIDSSDRSVNSEDTNKALKRAFEAKNSQAIVLNINSPGGSPVQSDEIWQEIRYYKQQYPEKKVYALIGDMGASGAYYIASAADEIWVNPSSLVGSIGVIMPNYGVMGLAQKLGVEDRTLTSGDNKDILSMTKPVNPAQREHVQAVLDNVHSHFIAAVKEGRGKRLKSNDPAIFSGLFWSGEQAVKLGVADRTGSINSLKRELKLDNVLDYTVQRSPFESVLGRVGSEIGQGFSESVTQQLKIQQDTKLQ
ncbi:signal peptide peptidase SppA [Acinetobacter radioresistens]|jgi:protease IV|uniref:Signal peptide peptidase SppA, 36K type n=1 Tax=Acinetobacter radioresistens SK82 TaxID=596318 RepID=A0ABM9YLD0_ACIRA|nr:MULTISPECIES: signal peptide peptidase SppA [Acinetobacter]EET81753.1 signal peptide peptidase SppA, 36K type [Acinetobacter radioresistens SK82]EEY86759.1 signal peptide peptidase SppA, 36K type [Acinetobacter radioresistens SH164]EXB34336.1 signal peptide peptidase SppA, 36K type [Acinetobacter sp. 1461402]EXE59110.1 signal peptide peptidase SppA, 36K type [Acinetobacter sp. 1239920]MCK4079731.1 signal peptide peptidase SppA [Acinetobacter radioresistens]